MFVIDKLRHQSRVAVGCAIGAGVLVWFFLGHLENTYQQSGEVVTVLVANRYIPRATPLSADYFEPFHLPKRYRQPDALSDYALLESSGAPRYRSLLAIPKGMQLIQQAIIPIVENESLSQALDSHQVAISFGVDAVHGLGGNIQPGDCIDILHTSKPLDLDPTPRQTAALLEAIPVIAVDKRWTASHPLGSDHEKNPLDPPEKTGDEVTVLTVRLNPVAALRLAQARENETLSVVLRSPGDLLP